MLPLACVVLPSRQCRVLRNLPALAVVARRIALPRRFGRVCRDLAALRRGAGRRVPLPIRIAGPAGKFQSHAGRTTRTMWSAVDAFYLSEESSRRRLARGRITAFLSPSGNWQWQNGSTDAVPFRRIDAESHVKACHNHEVGQPHLALLRRR